jgi:hypothetical protein
LGFAGIFFKNDFIHVSWKYGQNWLSVADESADLLTKLIGS